LSPAENRRSGQLALAPSARSPSPIAIPLPEARVDVPQRRRARRGRGRWAAMLMLLSLAAGAVYWLLLPPSMIVVHPRRGPAVQAVYATGTVEPTVMVPISARSTARLVELDADEGSIVSKGQVLARLEDDDLRRAIEAAEAEERYAKAAFDRQSLLAERQVAARSAYDRAKADWEKARATTAKAVAEARFLELVAPADGTVIRRDGEIGQLIGANQTVFWLFCCAPLRISAEVDEEDIAQIHPGQRVLIRSDSFPGRTFEGEVQAVTPKGDPVARSYRVRISLPADTPLMIGMTTETNIVLRQSQNALLLPAGAVQQDSAWRVVDGRLAPSKVTVGAKGAKEIEIVEGVDDSDWIVAAPSPSLKAGQHVRSVAGAEQR
jgi:multidrug efflux system membrane fusion protein